MNNKVLFKSVCIHAVFSAGCTVKTLLLGTLFTFEHCVKCAHISMSAFRQGLPLCSMSRIYIIYNAYMYEVCIQFTVYSSRSLLCSLLEGDIFSITQHVYSTWIFIWLINLLADPGKARGCSRNTFIIHSLINSVTVWAFSSHSFTAPPRPNG